MNDLDWKEQIRQNLEYAKRGETKIRFNADLYNYLQSRRNQNRQVAAATVAEPKTKSAEKKF